MSRPPVNELSHPVEAAVLDTLRSQQRAMNVAQLTKASGFGRTKTNRHIAGLVALGFLEPAEVPLTPDTRRAQGMGRVAKFWTISRSGSLALARYKRRLDIVEPEVVAAPQSNLFERPVLTRAGAGYFRNDGLKHIASVGYPC